MYSTQHNLLYFVPELNNKKLFSLDADTQIEVLLSGAFKVCQRDFCRNNAILLGII